MKKVNIILLIAAILLLIGMILADFLYLNVELPPYAYLPIIIAIWILLRGQAKKMDERKHRKE